MKIDFSKPYDPKNIEGDIYKKWEKSGYFNPDKLPKRHKKTFTIVIPPPNITGSLHVGHALNAVIQDIIIRKKRMEGFKTLWLPGIDHAGIATQNVVEKELKKEGLTRHELGREKFLKRVGQWKEKYGNIILDQFKKIGASCDWTRIRFTMDADYQEAVAEAFIQYYRKGWIYQGERVISWCPRCRTSLSDLELEYRLEKSSLWFIKYSLEKGGYIVVATTRPETMLGDSAIAVNPRDKRYKNLIGKNATLPIQRRTIPIIGDRRIEQEFGTGAVKITPAHDLLDADIGKDHNLPVYKVIGEDGRMTAEAGKLCEGLKVKECRQKVVEELERQGLMEKIEDYEHNAARCYRCNSLIEPIPSVQWFLKMSELAHVARDAVKKGKVAFHPKRFEKPYLDWLKNIRDWTISRQIWWGHQLPVWEHDPICIPKKGREKDTGKCKDIIVASTMPQCSYCEAGYKQIPDVLDTWFSSALWPFATLGWPKKTKDLKLFYPTQVLSTARDIINLWVLRMIFSGITFMKKAPFHDVIIHATILTKEGKRMSKSLGTGANPLNLIAEYGADATRFALIWQAMGGQDMRWSEEALVAGKKFLNKIWNATRFVLNAQNGLQIQNTKYKLKAITKEDKRLLKKLKEIIKNTHKDIERYNFGPALHRLYDFFWHDFCDQYLEASKKQLEDPKFKQNTQMILRHVLSTSLTLLHPFLPHITEKIWEVIPKRKDLLMIEAWPK